MQGIITVIVQVTSECNLRCGYCDVRASRSLAHRQPIKLSERDLGKLVHNCSLGYNKVKFDWLGGEPLSREMEFYQEVIREENLLTKSSGVAFRNTIQSNGTLLTKECARFLADNDFTIGISFDGLSRINAETRLKGLEATSEVFIRKCVDLLKSVGLPICLLCVVSKLNVNQGKEIFEFFSKLEVQSFSLLPLMPFPQKDCPEPPTNKELFELLKTVFELWLTSQYRFKTVEPISTMTRSLISGGKPDSCSFSAACLKQMITITPEGYVVPCGSLVKDEFILGNIFETTLLRILSSKRSREFQLLRAEAINKYCKGCEFISICRGGCREAAFWSSGRYDGIYPYCEARQETFRYMQRRLKEILMKSAC